LLNVIPEPDGDVVYTRFLYFAYGSNMSQERLTAADRAPSATRVATGYVSGRTLTFDKVSKDGSGKCDCQQTDDPEDKVYGVVFSVLESEKPALDHAEGKGFGYDETTVEVITESDVLTAATYFATNKNPVLKPYNWYKRHLLQGAIEGNLPSEYIRALERIESVVDDDPSRVARESRR
jgi:gamma-glutamylcyclotransferase